MSFRLLNFNNKKNIFIFFSTIFGIGMFPIFPGTISSILSAVSFYFLFNITNIYYLSIVFLLIMIFSTYVCGKSEKIFGIQDCDYIVLDEFIGMFFALVFLQKKLKLTIIGIVIFRILDIWKPWPIRYFDKNINGGIGIVLDDIVAGIFTNLILNFIRHKIYDF